MEQSSPTLEQRMLDAGKEHGFHAVSVGFNTNVSVGRWWTVNAHWEGFSRTGLGCAAGSADTPEDALEAAIAKASEQRAPYIDGSERDYHINRLREQLAALESEAIELPAIEGLAA